MTRTLPQWLAIAVFALLASITSFVNPLFEAPDEHLHFFTAVYIAENNRLPQVEERLDTLMGQEPAQPPLYYVVASTILRPFDLSAARQSLWLNPHVRLGDPDYPPNTNLVIDYHGADAYRAPAHVLRLLSVVVGVGTLWVFGRTATHLFPNHPTRQWLMVALPACLPQFIFLHSYINNDIFVIFFASAALLQLVAQWQQPTPTVRRALTLGLTIGLAMLSKMAGLLLLIYALGFLAVLAWQQRAAWRAWLRHGAIVASVALLCSAWLYWRNITLYGDLTATEPFIRIAGGDRQFTIWQVLRESDGLLKSFVAVFGWFNVTPHITVYLLWAAIGLLALLGAMLQMRRGKLSQLWLPLLLGGWLLAVYAGLFRFMLQTPAAQGRLLFPALLPIAAGVAFGLSRWQISRWLLPLVGVSTALYAFLWVIPRAYAVPQIVDKLPESVDNVAFSVGGSFEIVGAAVDNTDLAPDDLLWLDLVWRQPTIRREPAEVVYELFYLAVEDNGRQLVPQPVARVQAYHGRGLYPSVLWPADELVHERIGLPLAELTANTPLPAEVKVTVRIIGEPGSADLGLVKVGSAETRSDPPASTPAAQFGNGAIVLNSAELLTSTPHQPGDTVTLALDWRVQDDIDTRYTLLAHLGQPDQPPLLQADGPPAGDRLYSTTQWRAGEQIAGQLSIDLPDNFPAGDYMLSLGLYDSNLQRMPLSIVGTRQPNDVLLIPIRIVDK